jgi:polysaccharide export outer membrane protein
MMVSDSFTAGGSPRYMRILYLFLLLPVLAGCLPSAGPGAGAIIQTGQISEPPFAVVALNQSVADFLAAQGPASFASTFGMGSAAPAITLGVGDMVAVSIFEAASGGLFTGEAGTLGGGTKSVKLPEQPVSRNGTLSIPYVGQVRAAGLTPVEVQRAIEAALRDKAIEPQVIVTVTSSPSTFVTVAGDVRQAGRLPLNLGGDRVLDLIASSGGTTDADYNTFVRLTRGGASATVSLARVVRDNNQNIFLRPNDLLYVYADPQVYTAFGATLRNATVPFNTDRLTLAEAVGAAGGLTDQRADPRGVFVFRYESPEYFDAILQASPETLGSPAPTAAGVPVVYRLDFKDPRGFFAAQRFLMRDNDVLYVSNAPSTDLQKLLSVFTGGIGSVGAAAALSNNLGN